MRRGTMRISNGGTERRKESTELCTYHFLFESSHKSIHILNGSAVLCSAEGEGQRGEVSVEWGE